MYNKFLIVFVVIMLFAGVYVYFSNDLKVQADTSSSITSSLDNGSPQDSLSSSDYKISQDTAFLSTLTSLTKIKIDTSLFDDPSFNALNDNTVVLEPSVTGRPNPFAPVDSNLTLGSASTSLVVTNQPTGITAKTAVLNGAVNTAPGSNIAVTNTYFEYGPTPALGMITPVAKQSLIGTFVKSINGLTTGTTYFFRAAAKIGGTIYYGDIVSFNTN